MIKIKEYQYLLVVLLMAIMGISLQSCNNNRVFYGKATINETWAYSDTLIYEFEITDTLTHYLLGMVVNWDTETYPYQNCYLSFNTQYPDGKNQSEIINIDLTDGIGLVNGTCSGSDCDVELILQPSIRFNQLGNYKIKINQNTREKHLPGMTSMALYLERKES